MATLIEKLSQLAIEHERKAAGIRLTIAELNGHATARARATLPVKLRAAAKLRPRRRRSAPRGEMSVAILDTLGTSKPRAVAEVVAALPAGVVRDPRRAMQLVGQRLGTLVKSGHAKRKGKGVYIATGKPYEPVARGKQA